LTVCEYINSSKSGKRRSGHTGDGDPTLLLDDCVCEIRDTVWEVGCRDDCP
jgi:hypothetical protein